MYKQQFLIYSLSLIVFHSVVGMQLTKMPLGIKKGFVRSMIFKSPELDSMRKKWSMKNSPQEVVAISEGKIVIKEEIPLGKRYGTCHNYALTKAMGILGKAPALLNIRGQKDYYTKLTIQKFFDLREPSPLMHSGDIVVYFSEDEKGALDKIVHTGIVVGDNCIESKWGPIPAVFEHPVWCIPANFGNHTRYFRLKTSGSDLLQAVQKRLQQKRIKKFYDAQADLSQKEFFDEIKEYGYDGCSYHLDEIYTSLEYQMNIHLDVPDKDGFTPLMYADMIGCKRLQNLLAAYAAYNNG